MDFVCDIWWLICFGANRAPGKPLGEHLGHGQFAGAGGEAGSGGATNARGAAGIGWV